MVQQASPLGRYQFGLRHGFVALALASGLFAFGRLVGAIPAALILGMVLVTIGVLYLTPTSRAAASLSAVLLAGIVFMVCHALLGPLADETFIAGIVAYCFACVIVGEIAVIVCWHRNGRQQH